ncbi:segregation and condensation protein A [Dehalobacterium formicoaceticum]|uniref:Segregation and condensation protein A n=1 Tax=Dehalobacterium formicoaceticum TaxID=51515 RepID=A0ABT1Y5L3_9FIRM|nr:segregation/condensation protein A [Dehalobacterium formicoaceticum]MCR6545843.1 segregation/condensation protein A [Dehalobacterium formicoaceticum]
MKYQIKLEVFQGPFDLLFHLIEKNEVDIYNIPIAEITRQYLDYLTEMEKMDLDIASEFLVMASTLLAIKAKMLLPKPPKPEEEAAEEDEDPRDQLVEQLLEYKKYKLVAEFLQQQEEEQGKIFVRPNDEAFYLALFDDPSPLEGVKLEDLRAALQSVLTRIPVVDPVQEIFREEITIKQKIEDIQKVVSEHEEGISFFALFSPEVGRVEVVIQFLALLELMRLHEIKVSQVSPHGDIIIFKG